MNKYAALVIFSLVIFTSCEPKPAESSAASSKDSAKTETAVAPLPEAQLSGKAAMIAKSWKAEEIETPTVKLSGDLIDIKFDFKSDGSFEYSEDGKKQNGKWKMNQEETMITLEYSDARKVDYDIKEVADGKMTIAGKEHDLYRTLKLVSK